MFPSDRLRKSTQHWSKVCRKKCENVLVVICWVGQLSKEPEIPQDYTIAGQLLNLSGKVEKWHKHFHIDCYWGLVIEDLFSMWTIPSPTIKKKCFKRRKKKPSQKFHLNPLSYSMLPYFCPPNNYALSYCYLWITPYFRILALQSRVIIPVMGFSTVGFEVISE